MKAHQSDKMTFAMHIFEDTILPKLGKVYRGIITMFANVLYLQFRKYINIRMLQKSCNIHIFTGFL